jgi:hypothetical protein
MRAVGVGRAFDDGKARRLCAQIHVERHAGQEARGPTLSGRGAFRGQERGGLPPARSFFIQVPFRRGALYRAAMLNRSGPEGDIAVIRFEDAEFTVIRAGRFVRCGVSGALIPVEELRYWSVDLQEAYRGPEEAMIRWHEIHKANA